MAGVKVTFSAIDKMSSAFDHMTSAGERALDYFDKMQTGGNSAYSAVTDAADKAASAISKATSATDYWTDAIGNYDKGAMEAVWSTEELVEMGFKTEDALAEVADTAEEAADKIDKLGKENEEATKKTEEFGEKSKDAVIGLDDILATVGIAAALHGIADAFAECSDAAAEFETSIAMVSTISDSTVLSTEQLSAQIKQVSRDSAVAVTDLAEATYGAISASVATADAVAFVEQANQLAVGGFTSQATAVDVLTTAINAYNLEAQNAAQISDYLVTTQNLGKTTVDQLASSIGMVIPSAAAFNVQMDNLSTAYAILTSNGVQTAQSTTYLKAMFTELAKSESEVAKVLQEETGQSFAELMEAGYSLGDVMEILGDSVDGNTTAFMNMWSSMEAGSGAVSLYNSGAERYAQVLDQMRDSAGATTDAYEKMTNTTEFSSQRMENSFNNLKIAIGDDLNPAVGTFKDGISDAVDGLTSFIDKFPAVTAILAGASVALGTLTIAIGGYAVATKVATLATNAWMAIMKMPSAFLAVTAITALTAGVIAFATVLGESTDEYDTWTESTRRQYDELRQLEAEYENAVEVYGETSEEALSLRYQVDELSDSFANNKQTLEELLAESDAVIESSRNMTEEYESGKRALHENEIRTMALIQRLDELATSTETSVSSQYEMEAIISELNETVTGLNLSYGDLVENQDEALRSLRSYAEAQAKQERMQQQYESYVNALGQEAVVREKLSEMTAEQAMAQERYDKAVNAYANKLNELSRNDYGTAGIAIMFTSQDKELDAAGDALEDINAKVAELEAELRTHEATIQECEEAWGELASEAESAATTTVGLGEAINTAISESKEALEELATKYDEVYNSAYDSITGQIGLFETMKTESEQSVADMQKALESQIEYMQLYTANLQKASEYGLNDSLISSLSDGSSESAGQLNAIIAKIEELGGTTEGMSQEAKDFIDSFNTTFSQVENSRTTWATTVAQMETDFSSSLDAIETEMEEAIEGMNMADAAKRNAISTIEGYIEGIKSMVPEAKLAMEAIKWADDDLNFIGPRLPRYASGTDYAEAGLALVGEYGPELVQFSGGEKVYTADETADIVGHGSLNDEFYIAPAEADEHPAASGDRTVTLKLEGAGEMKVRGGVNKEDLLDFIVGNIKGILMDILEEEILEEGDLSYVY